MQFDIIYTGDCLNLLKTLHDDSVHCCVTSPSVFRDTGRYLHNDIIRMKDKIALFHKKKDAAANMT